MLPLRNIFRKFYVLWKENASAYTRSLQNIVDAVPVAQAWGKHVYYAYVVRVQNREYFRSLLEQDGIATGIHYPIPLHLQQAYKCYGFAPGSLPVMETVAKQIVSLPMFPELTDEQIHEVVSAVEKAAISSISC